MKDNQKKVLKWLALSEGGYINHKDDPGGATNMGVTQRTYNAYNRARGLPQKNVRHITEREVERIYIQQYFTPVWFNKLPSGLDYAMSDYSVNSGPSRAVKDMQRTLNKHGAGLSVDGVMGDMTYAAIMDVGAPDLIVDLCERRMKFLRRLRHWKTFGKGWTRRVMGSEMGVQLTDIGVIDRSVKLSRGETVTNHPSTAPGKGTGDPDHRGLIGGLGAGGAGITAAIGTTVSGLGDNAQVILIGALVVAGLGLLWVMRSKIREWAEG